MCPPEDWRIELGRQIREGRDDSFLRQEDLSERVGIHTNMIGRYERGMAAPDLELLIRIAAALDIDEFRLGDTIVSIKTPADENTRAVEKQMRLRFDREYVFEGAETAMKLQPKREGLFIRPEKRRQAV